MVWGRPTAWLLAEDLDDVQAASPPRCVRLLPAFDPWIVGALREPPFMPPKSVGEVYGPAGRFAPVVLVDGWVVARWQHHRQGPEVRLTIDLYTALPRRARAAVEHEAERVAAYLDGRLHLTWQDD